MTARWYIARGGKTGRVFPDRRAEGSIGPVSEARLLELVSGGVVSADDWVWMKDTDVLITAEQFQALAREGKLPGGKEAAAVAAPAAAAGAQSKQTLPDWLADVASAGPAKAAEPPPLPDWLDDVREGEKRSACSVEAAPPEAADIPLDWLEDIRQIEEALRRPAPAPAEKAPPAESPSPAPPARADAVSAPSQPAPVSASAPPLTPPAASAPPPLVGPAPGCYNPETGEILDPVAYAAWQKAEVERRREELARQPTMSVTEAFLEAQRALQDWVDDTANRPLVAVGDMEPIRNSPAVQELLQRYEAYGPLMQEKLSRRLELLVDNRKKFFKAFC